MFHLQLDLPVCDSCGLKDLQQI